MSTFGDSEKQDAIRTLEKFQSAGEIKIQITAI